MLTEKQVFIISKIIFSTLYFVFSYIKSQNIIRDLELYKIYPWICLHQIAHKENNIVYKALQEDEDPLGLSANRC